VTSAATENELAWLYAQRFAPILFRAAANFDFETPCDACAETHLAEQTERVLLRKRQLTNLKEGAPLNS
jgi:hypothetical protein